jgi:serine/threonine protein kinase
MDEISALAGNDRFEIRRRLGAGGFGTVYAAFDRANSSLIALKLLHNLSAGSLYRFKQEFRILSRIVHPNLVLLHELLVIQDQWLLVMELVDGVDLRSFLATDELGSAPTTLEPPAESAEETLFSASVSDTMAVTPHLAPRGSLHGAPATAVAPEPAVRTIPQRPLDEQRLRAAFRQLAHGIEALHQAQILHGDLKPSNVRVAPDGRIVLLDFGLARLLPARGPAEPATRSGEVVGTPPFMAPEQIVGQPDSTASDWYSFGVMLYQALTGRLPFRAPTVRELFAAKLHRDPAPPSAQVSGVPSDLEALCLALLRREPRDRPDAAEVLRRLGNRESPEPPEPAPALFTQLVGREEELALLAESFAASQAGRLEVVHVTGLSGMGKSALLRETADRLIHRHGAVVLTGRCYERESVPYKAFDSLVDTLAGYLKSLPAAEASALMPDGIFELARLFPVLYSAVERGMSQRVPEIADPQLAQWESFHALKALLSRIGTRHPLVLCIDDLQWSDSDSIRLLVEILSPPVPRLLAILGSRHAEPETAPILQELRQSLSSPAPGLTVREIQVGPLPEGTALRLAVSRLGAAAEPGLAGAIVRESGGNPLLIEQLAHYVQGRRGTAAWDLAAYDGVTLAHVIEWRVRALPAPAQRLLEVFAVAGHPLEQEIAFLAAAAGEEGLSSLTSLRSSQLLRPRSVGERPGFEVQHDRIRDAVVQRLDGEAARSWHRRLALAFESAPHPEPEALAVHYHGAGELAKAALHAAAAGDRAGRALAFDRAAEMYSNALAWGSEMSTDLRRSLEIRHADALTNAGRCFEAGAAYLAAAAAGAPATSRDLRRHATEQFFLGGHLDDGMKILQPLLAEVGIPYPATTRGAVLTVIALYLRLRLRGFHYRERPAADITPGLLTAIDLCSAVSKALTAVDPLRSAVFQFRSMLLSLRAGEVSRVATALSSFGMVMALQGTPRAVEKGERLILRGRALAQQTGDPRLIGLVEIHRCGVFLLLRGRWSAALAGFQAVAQHLRENCAGVSLERNLTEICIQIALEALGRLRERGERATGLERDAVKRGDLYGRISAVHSSLTPLLAADDVEAARWREREIIEMWTRGGFHVQHVDSLRFRVQADLYEGMPAAARGRLEAAWRDIVRTQQLRIQPSRVDMLLLRARTGLAVAACEPSRARELLREVEQDARRLAREVRSDAEPLARLLQAGAAFLQRRGETCRDRLDQAIAGFDATEMALLAACARWRKGELIGGTEGRELTTAAGQAMMNLGVKRPERWVDAAAPGFGGGA